MGVLPRWWVTKAIVRWSRDQWQIRVSNVADCKRSSNRQTIRLSQIRNSSTKMVPMSQVSTKTTKTISLPIQILTNFWWTVMANFRSCESWIRLHQNRFINLLKGKVWRGREEEELPHPCPTLLSKKLQTVRWESRRRDRDITSKSEAENSKEILIDFSKVK